jgi:6-phosphogluconolactonase/glucosamine-6-phosphate isomerase/deaminase
MKYQNNLKFIKFDIDILYEELKGQKNIIVTGGRSVNFFLKEILKKISLKEKNKINLFLSDERISDNIKDTNSNKIRYLVKKKNINFYKIDNYSKNLISETKKYSNLLNRNIDIAFLSLGENYHIASLFFDFPIIFQSKYAALTYSDKFKFLRISINQRLISKTKKIFLFINGKNRLKDFHFMLKKKILNFYFNKKAQKKLIVVIKKK